MRKFLIFFLFAVLLPNMALAQHDSYIVKQVGLINDVIKQNSSEKEKKTSPTYFKADVKNKILHLVASREKEISFNTDDIETFKNMMGWMIPSAIIRVAYTYKKKGINLLGGIEKANNFLNTLVEDGYVVEVTLKSPTKEFSYQIDASLLNLR